MSTSCLTRFLLCFCLFLQPFIVNAQEIITSFDNSTTPVLNEELRKIRKSVDSTEASIAALNTVPAGVIVMWSGTIATIPTGWVLCDGDNGTPDLRDRFIVGATSDDGGVAKTNVTGSLTQSGNGTIPAHTHTMGGGFGRYDGDSGTGMSAQIATASTGSYGTGTKNIAVYYALCFIMKS